MFARLDGDRRDARLLDRLGRLDLAAVSFSALHFDDGENECVVLGERLIVTVMSTRKNKKRDQCQMKKQKKEDEETNFFMFVIDLILKRRCFQSRRCEK